MADPRELLRRKFENNTFTNFGNIIKKMVVNGVRCHTNTIIEIRSPITAISGYNGTGKSTLLQLAAASYKQDAVNYSISDFITRGPLDRAPFKDDASVQFDFETQQASDGKLVSPGTVTLAYRQSETRWDGYERRPIRTVFFGGIGLFLPRSERKDYVFSNPTKLKIANTVTITDEIRDWAAKILTCGYESISSNELKFRTFRDKVLSAVSNGRCYSESNMGCGEGKIQFLLTTFESLPPKSLILLEEPETSLHPNAEYELGKYLMDLCIRKGHQILITTHSEMLLRSLPQASLVFLRRKNDGVVQPIAGITSGQASSLMADGFNRSLTILVEDLAAKHILTEILRSRDSTFLQTVKIAIAGETDRQGNVIASGKDAIRNTMTSLKNAGLKIAAVLDGGENLTTQDASRFIFKLPGNLAPEEALFQCVAVKANLTQRYSNLNIAAVEAELRATDCHDYFKEIGRKVDCEQSFLIQEAARVYAPNAGATETNTLYEQLKDAANRQ
jgi:predicted ATPase